jgi:hypothetical protein
LPDELRQPYARLLQKRDARTLTPAEHEELIRLSDAVETFQARRLELLAELAQLRGVTLDTVLQDLGIAPRSIVSMIAGRSTSRGAPTR